MWQFNYTDELFHYGVKGMRWGVRRTRQQLRNDRQIRTIRSKNGITITGLSKHANDQLLSRSVKTEHIADALTNPLHIGNVKNDDLGRKSQRFVGASATVNVNPDLGVITTVWTTGRHTKQKYLKEKP